MTSSIQRCYEQYSTMSSTQRCYEQYSTIKRAFRRIVSVLSDHVITIFNPLAKIRKLVERCKKKWGNVRKHYEKRRKKRQICNGKAISMQRTSVIIGRLAFTWAKIIRFAATIPPNCFACTSFLRHFCYAEQTIH